MGVPLEPAPRAREITVPGEPVPLAAWAAVGAAGQAVLFGPVANWYVTSTGGQGYVADGLAWQEPAGRYQALVRLSATGPVNVEVWNDSGDRLLVRRSIPATAGIETVAVPVVAASAYDAGAYSGWGRSAAFLAAAGSAPGGPGVVPGKRDGERLQRGTCQGGRHAPPADNRLMSWTGTDGKLEDWHSPR